MWTPEAVYGMVRDLIVVYYVASLIYVIILGFASSMFSSGDD